MDYISVVLLLVLFWLFLPNSNLFLLTKGLLRKQHSSGAVPVFPLATGLYFRRPILSPSGDTKTDGDSVIVTDH